MTRRFKNALFTESSGFCTSFYSLNLYVLILISLVTPPDLRAWQESLISEGVGVDQASPVLSCVASLCRILDWE